MTDRIDRKLEELGLALPQAAAPVAAYVPAVISGNQLFVSGQVPFWNGELRGVGKLGAGYTVEEADVFAAQLRAEETLSDAELQRRAGDEAGLSADS